MFHSGVKRFTLLDSTMNQLTRCPAAVFHLFHSEGQKPGFLGVPEGEPKGAVWIPYESCVSGSVAPAFSAGRHFATTIETSETCYAGQRLSRFITE